MDVFCDDTTSTAIMFFLCGVVVSEHSGGFHLTVIKKQKMETLEREGKDDPFFFPRFIIFGVEFFLLLFDITIL